MSLLKTHLKTVVNPTWNFAGRCLNKYDELMNAVLGLVGEAGEVADQHKRWFFHNEQPREAQ